MSPRSALSALSASPPSPLSLYASGLHALPNLFAGTAPLATIGAPVRQPGCGLLGCTEDGHYKTSHCKNFPGCKAIRNVGHEDDCPYKKQPGCGKIGCTADGHRPASHCANWPECTGLRGEHDEECSFKKATGVDALIQAADAQLKWWSMTFTRTGGDVPDSWLDLIFAALRDTFKAVKVRQRLRSLWLGKIDWLTMFDSDERNA